MKQNLNDYQTMTEKFKKIKNDITVTTDERFAFKRVMSKFQPNCIIIQKVTNVKNNRDL